MSSVLKPPVPAPDTIIITIDEGATIDSLNPATERLFGYGRGEL